MTPLLSCIWPKIICIYMGVVLNYYILNLQKFIYLQVRLDWIVHYVLDSNMYTIRRLSMQL